MEFRTLEKTPIETIRTAFCLAFSDYEVPVNISLETLNEMITERDLIMSLSVGCFVGELLVGFILCGYREDASGPKLYDGGTGVIPSYRGKRIASSMLDWILSEEKFQSIERFILEVLEHNTRAQNLYQSAQFSISRFFRCYRIEKEQVPHSSLPANWKVISMDRNQFSSLHHEAWYPYPPSWQNDVPSILNTWDRREALVLEIDGSMAGYGIIHREKGSIAQLSIPTGLHDRLSWDILIDALARRTDSQMLSIINVESESSVDYLCRTRNWENHINQYEMIRRSK